MSLDYVSHSDRLGDRDLVISFLNLLTYERIGPGNNGLILVKGSGDWSIQGLSFINRLSKTLPRSNSLPVIKLILKGKLCLIPTATGSLIS